MFRKYTLLKRSEPAWISPGHLVAVSVLVWGACGAERTRAQDARPVAKPIPSTRAVRPVSEVSWTGPGPLVTGTLYADGTEVTWETEELWRPICGSGTTSMTSDDLKALAQTTRTLQARLSQARILDPNGVPGLRSGLDVAFNNLTTPPAEAIAALAEIESYVEGRFDDPITVTIDLSFATLAPDVLGSTSALRVSNVDWNTAGTAIRNDMDGNDLIQLLLPYTTVPVRYDAGTSDITDEAVVTFTYALYQATVGTLSGPAGTITINTDFPWDYSPPDIEVDKYCFQSIMIHEIGHVMGFLSRADFSPNSRIEVLDVFRFQRTDGTENRNPDSLFDLARTARTVDFNNLNDDVNTDLILDEYRMADGSPDQASHFKNQAPGICLMDPVFLSQETFYPNFFRSCDLAVFDAIGWDRTGTVPPPLPAPYPHDRRKNRYVSFDPNPANAGIDVAFLVWVQGIALASCDGNAARCRLDRGDNDCKACSISGAACRNSIGCPDGESCDPTGDACVNDLAKSVFDLEGRTWWVGQPDVDGVAHLVSREYRHVSDSWPDVVHVGDCEIVPRATYGIRSYDLTDLSVSELFVETIAKPGSNYWADAVGPRSFYCDGDERDEPCDPDNNLCPMGRPCTAIWPSPNGATNFDDVTAALFAFQGGAGLTLPDIKSVDLHGNDGGNAWVDPPNHIPNLADVQFIVLAFQGNAYPFVDPADCPDVP